MAYHRKRVISPCVSYMAAAEEAGSAVLHSVALWVSCLGLRLRQQLLCETHPSPDLHQEQKGWEKFGMALKASARTWHLHTCLRALGQWKPCAGAQAGWGMFCSLGKSHAVGRDVELWSLLWWGMGGNNWGLWVNLPAHFQKLITYFLAFKEYWEWDHCFVLFLWLWVIVINNSDFP